jgi:hypothetical protein
MGLVKCKQINILSFSVYDSISMLLDYLTNSSNLKLIKLDYSLDSKFIFRGWLEELYWLHKS